MRGSYSAIAATLFLTIPTFVPAQDAQPPVAFPWEGEIGAANVYVRSGAGTNYYPTVKLGAGDRVLVLGEKFGWYQIAPPPRSFSYVDVSMVDRNPGAKSGVLKQDKVYIRAGSHLESRKSSTQVVLNKGAKVEILGEADGFFKITPPAGASLFVSKQYVRPVGSRSGTGLVERHVTTPPTSGDSVRTRIPESPVPAEEAAPAVANPAQKIEAGRVQLPDDPADAGSALIDGSESPPVMATKQPAIEETPPSEDPLAATAAKSGRATPGAEKRASTGQYQAMLTALESELASISRRPLDDQDFSKLVTRYEPIAAQSEEPVPAQIARIRVRQMKDRDSLKLARLDSRKDEVGIATYRASMDDERRKIMNRRVDAAMERYDLEGELRQSLAFAPEQRRYRLVKPGTDSTIAYVEIPRNLPENPEYLIGRLVGIKTSGLGFSAAMRVPFGVASKLVDLSPRTHPKSEAAPPTDVSEPAVEAGPNGKSAVKANTPVAGPTPAAHSNADDEE